MDLPAGAEACVASAVPAKRSLEGGEPKKKKKKKEEEEEEEEEEERKKQGPPLGTFTL